MASDEGRLPPEEDKALCAVVADGKTIRLLMSEVRRRPTPSIVEEREASDVRRCGRKNGPGAYSAEERMEEEPIQWTG